MRRRSGLDEHALSQSVLVWVCGISFGAWIGMQLLMRRPEITGFISIAPPASMYDFAFLAPCPASGLIVHGTKDQVVPEADVQKLVDRLTAQKGIKIAYDKIEGANHFFDKPRSRGSGIGGSLCRQDDGRGSSAEGIELFSSSTPIRHRPSLRCR